MNVSGICFTAFSSVLEEYHVRLLVIFTILFCHFFFWFHDLSQSVMDDLLEERWWILVLYKNSFCSIQTCDSLSNVKLEENEELVSFDVVSLYTNVPVMEAIHVCADLLFKKCSLPVNKETFIELAQMQCINTDS